MVPDSKFLSDFPYWLNQLAFEESYFILHVNPWSEDRCLKFVLLLPRLLPKGLEASDRSTFPWTLPHTTSKVKRTKRIKPLKEKKESKI